MPGLAVDDLAVVCCSFNPVGSKSRARNHRAFADSIRHSGVRLLTVELALGDQAHELGAEVGDVLHVRSSSLLWHKERLLNLGIEQLVREGFRKIVWLDADVAFAEHRDWPWFVAAALERAPVCQVFSRLIADTDVRQVPAISAVHHYRRSGQVVDQPALRPTWRHPLGLPMGMSGYGWAARSEVLRAALLYDRAIVGGGDKMICTASLDNGLRGDPLGQFIESPFEPCAVCATMTSASRAYRADLESWAAAWRLAMESGAAPEPGVPPSDAVAADLTLRAMFHGTWSQRSYWLRQEILAVHAFDPIRDLELNDDGCWQWASDKPELHRLVRRYFLSRDEDVGGDLQAGSSTTASGWNLGSASR